MREFDQEYWRRAERETARPPARTPGAWSPGRVAACVAAAVVTGAIAINAMFLQDGRHPAPWGSTVAVVSVPHAAPVPQPAARPTAPATTAAVPTPRPRGDEIAQVLDDERRRSELVAAVQRELATRGFYTGTPDGVAGPRTERAVRDYQVAAGLRETGDVTDVLLAHILRNQVRAPVVLPGARAERPPVTPASVPAAPAPLVLPASAPVQPVAAPAAQATTADPRRIAAVQRTMSEFGFAELKVTGTLGPETRAAIERFERQQQLPVTGQVTERVVRELVRVTGRPIP